MTIVNIVTWETQHSTADLGYFKTQILQATEEVSCVFCKQNICSSNLDVQETDCCLAQFYRV